MLKAVGLVATAGLVAVPVGAWALAHQLQGEITTVDTEGLLPPASGTPDPTDPEEGKALTILLVGLDSREGANDKFAGDENPGARGDVTIVAHVSADRKRVDMVSIPRDTMVAIPSCRLDKDGRKTTRAQAAQSINAAFQYGYDAGGSYGAGAICTAQTVTAVTGIHLDGFVIVDFAGVQGMVDALGGVPVCVESHIDSPEADHLVLDPGFQTLDGWHATEYARARHGVEGSDASDLNRILRQQELVASIANEVFAKNLLTEYPDLVRFLHAVAKSLTMSSNLGSITFTARLGYSLRNLDANRITLITAPYEAYPPNPAAKVQLAPTAQKIFDNIRHDRPMVAAPKQVKKPAGGASPGGSATRTPTQGSTPTSTPRDRATQGIAAADVPTTKAQCDAAIAARR